MQLDIYLFIISGIIVNMIFLYVTIFEIDYEKYLKRYNSRILKELSNVTGILKEHLGRRPAMGSMALLFISFLTWIATAGVLITFLRVISDIEEKEK